MTAVTFKLSPEQASLRTRITRPIAEAKRPAFLDRLGSMFVGTIHAYCLHMLQDHLPEFGNRREGGFVDEGNCRRGFPGSPRRHQMPGL
jgi:hypothetical protein